MKFKLFLCSSIILPVFLSFLWGCNSNSKTSSALLFERAIPSHPRLLFSSEEEQKIKQLKEEDPLLQDLFGFLKVKADELLTAPLIKYDLRKEYSDILVISREHIYRIITLSLAYRLFGDIQYAKKAEENLVNVCNYPNWDPKHFLDVAEMTEAVAIGYDWLYDVLPEQSKVLIKKAIKEKALDLAIREYANGDNSSWSRRESNWNVVCNTGMIMGSLAVAEDYPDIAEKIISTATRFIPNCLKYYDPDGVCYEGTSYWNYTNMNLALLLKSLDDNLGQDYGLSNLPGVSKTADFYVASVSPGGKIFNFADATGTTPTKNPEYFYFSKKYKSPRVAEFYRSLLAKTLKTPEPFSRWHFFLCIPWYDMSTGESGTEKPRFQVFKNEYNPIVVFQGKPSEKNSIYLIAKGGAPEVAHQQLDVGTFVLETNGVRWADDLGADKYSLPGFWDYKPHGQRWNYFRNTNFSHNTLSIDGRLQYSGGKGTLLRYNAEAEHPFGIIDMSSVYKEGASKVYRGFMLLSDNLVLVQDEVSLNKEAKEVEWSLITSANIEVNRNMAVLKKEGKELFLKIESPVNARFSVTEAHSFTPDEYPVSGYYLLKINIPQNPDRNQTIQVAMSSDANAIREKIDLKKLSEWK